MHWDFGGGFNLELSVSFGTARRGNQCHSRDGPPPLMWITVGAACISAPVLLHDTFRCGLRFHCLAITIFDSRCWKESRSDFRAFAIPRLSHQAPTADGSFGGCVWIDPSRCLSFGFRPGLCIPKHQTAAGLRPRPRASVQRRRRREGSWAQE